MIEQQHDGILGDDERTTSDAHVIYDDDIWLRGRREFVRGIRLKDNDYHEFPLTPQQALSLLAWLQQEKRTLKRLARESYPWNLMQRDGKDKS